ncbi:pirin [Halorubrum californiense DSM 19288]|uniref:Pirin n=1 Tax=Halorubrum californiense DSM 19288 TaxID=1227465 RepID=M0E103_9EURY|nr:MULTISPECIES: pirin family protein [Halorubrum]ELZ40009.1 pirin [Halorubrum californiense DSM 19288]TKX73268.1 pirin family protein [Halorubrum sp. GN11GM_10-3_MGM]
MTENESSATRTKPLSGQTVRHGTGVNSNRAFPTEAHPQHLDPFALFERFYIEPDQGFPMHPHRGFEIVSYMIEGGMDHEDSLGVANTARENEAMHITTGGGIRHSEFPADGADCNGLQLWVNLPREDKEMEPDYSDAEAEELPTEELDGATVTTVVGDGSPLSTHTPLEYLNAEVTDSWRWELPEERTGFLYAVDGAGTVTVDGAESSDAFAEGEVLPVTDAGTVDVTTDESLRSVAVSGRPHGEPIRQQGPFVL